MGLFTGAAFICRNSPWAGKVDVGLSVSRLAIGGECKHGWAGNAATGTSSLGVAAVGSSSQGPTINLSSVGLELGVPPTGEMDGVRLRAGDKPSQATQTGRGWMGRDESRQTPLPAGLSSSRFIFFLSAATPPVISSPVSIGGSAAGRRARMGRSCPSLLSPGAALTPAPRGSGEGS